MGSLLLCRNTEGKHPFYVKDLGMNLYSAEELCYFIYNHAFFLDQSFFGEELFSFLALECRLPQLEKKLRSWIAEGADVTALLLVILQDIHYYSEFELLSFQENMNKIRKASQAERMKWKGDYMLRQQKFESAIRMYDAAMTEEEAKPDARLRGNIFYNRGVAYAQLFAFKEACDSLSKAFGLLKSDDILKRIFMIYQLDPTVPIDENLMDQLSAEQQFKWKEEMEVMKRHAAYSGKALVVRDILEKKSVRRGAELEKLLVTWKQEYRGIVR